MIIHINRLIEGDYAGDIKVQCWFLDSLSFLPEFIFSEIPQVGSQSFQQFSGSFDRLYLLLESILSSHFEVLPPFQVTISLRLVLLQVDARVLSCLLNPLQLSKGDYFRQDLLLLFLFHSALLAFLSPSFFLQTFMVIAFRNYLFSQVVDLIWQV